MQRQQAPQFRVAGGVGNQLRLTGFERICQRALLSGEYHPPVSGGKPARFSGDQLIVFEQQHRAYQAGGFVLLAQRADAQVERAVEHNGVIERRAERFNHRIKNLQPFALLQLGGAFGFFAQCQQAAVTLAQQAHHPPAEQAQRRPGCQVKPHQDARR